MGGADSVCEGNSERWALGTKGLIEKSERRGHSRKRNGSEAQDQIKQPKTFGGSGLAEESGKVSH